VQVYFSPADPAQPVRLVGWAAAVVPARGSDEVVVRCDERMWRRWDDGWADVGGGDLLVARGLGDVRLRLSLGQ
jgi:beta-glucosidase